MGDKEPHQGREQTTVDLLRELAASVEAFTNAISPRGRLNRTDLRALDIITLRKGLTAGQLADQLKLTTGAVTGVLDRLERAGCARRIHDPEDRRRVVVQPTAEARRLGCALLAGLRRDLGAILASHSEREQELIQDFLRAVIHAIQLRADELGRERPRSRALPRARQLAPRSRRRPPARANRPGQLPAGE
ncbi:MAG TPA: MarR family transcriptional regulator [Candidatus Dormibacteraeota bacterium]|nr:MarR family transcriptional regulator [Candidatus Dormibacteraeota bacterium]